MKVCQQRGHLLVIESSGKTRHHPLPGKYVLPHRRVRCWDAAGQSVLIEEPMQIRRHFLQGQIVILVAMGAAHMVKMLAFQLFRGQLRSRMTARQPNS